MLKGFNIKYLLNEDNSNETIYDKDIKESGDLFVLKEIVRDSLSPLLEEIDLVPLKKKVDSEEKVDKVEKVDIVEK
jgi:hypothetical protein